MQETKVYCGYIFPLPQKHEQHEKAGKKESYAPTAVSLGRHVSSCLAPGASHAEFPAICPLPTFSPKPTA